MGWVTGAVSKNVFAIKLHNPEKVIILPADLKTGNTRVPRLLNFVFAKRRSGSKEILARENSRRLKNPKLRMR